MKSFLHCFSLRVHNAEDKYRMRWWITFVVMLVAIIEVLDMTIVTVSLPEMIGSFGVNIDQITWILTSYAVSSAIVMPLTGLLVARLGCRKLLLIAVTGFMAGSMICGLSTNFLLMILGRISQGLFGASFIPLSQYILKEIFPQKELGLAMAIWAMGIVCAPVFGPTLGGIIVNFLSWHWIFFINIPVCLLAFGMILILIQETQIKSKKIDWLSLLSMTGGVSALQVLLDRGNSVDWYEAASTCWLTISAIILLSSFLWRSWIVPDALINLRLFKDRNFLISTLLMFSFSLFIFGQICQTPLMLQSLFNYSSLTTGILMTPRGVGAILGMTLIGPFIHRVNAKAFLYTSLIFTGINSALLSQMSTNFNVTYFVVVSGLQGVGMGFFLLMVSVLSLSTLNAKDLAEASGLFSFSRNLGMSIGVSLMVTFLTRNAQTNWHHLTGHINVFNPNLAAWFTKGHESGLENPLIFLRIAKALYEQAQIIAFNNVAWLTAYGLIAIIPLVSLLKPAKLALKH